MRGRLPPRGEEYWHLSLLSAAREWLVEGLTAKPPSPYSAGGMKKGGEGGSIQAGEGGGEKLEEVIPKLKQMKFCQDMIKNVPAEGKVYASPKGQGKYGVVINSSIWA